MTRPSATVIHPFLLALYPVLLLYVRNTDSLYFRETLTALILVPLITAIFWVFLRRLVGDPSRAGLIISAVLFLVFSFERNVYAVKVRGLGASADSREWFVLIASLVTLGLWIFALKLKPGWVRPINTTANAGSVMLLVFLIPALFEAVRSARPTPVSRAIEPRSGLSPKPSNARGSGGNPDIYFIVLDAYGRSDVLRSMLGFDNRPFLDRMVARGFYVASQSTANYCQTALSISATLSGNYHENLAGSPSKSRLPLRDLVESNGFVSLLKSRAYTLFGFASGFGLTDGFPADIRIAPTFDFSEFNGLLLDTTPVWTTLGLGSGRASHRRHRERIVHLFDHLAEVADDPRPTFCLAHVVAPHPPFVFDAEGRDVSGENSSYRLTDGKLWSNLDGHGASDAYANHYRAQAAYITRRVELAVDQILERSPEPPVIIIQGDHGPGSHFDSDSDQPNDLSERMGILNLCLIPGSGRDRLYPSITPINTFRVVSDQCFGTSRGLLPDRNYYSSYQSPYRLTDVSTEVAGPITETRVESIGTKR